MLPANVPVIEIIDVDDQASKNISDVLDVSSGIESLNETSCSKIYSVSSFTNDDLSETTD